MNQLETDAVRDRYERRKTSVESNRYSPLNAEVWQGAHERQRVMLRLFAKLGLTSFEDTSWLKSGAARAATCWSFCALAFSLKT
jgi:hypothetical protein